MPIRLKVLRRNEERINKIADLLQTYNINPNPNYQPIGGSSLVVNRPAVTTDPKIQAQKNLFQMFHLA